jgi:hypothetical protein
MKRTICAMMTAAAVVGCQSPGTPVGGNMSPAGAGSLAKAAPTRSAGREMVDPNVTPVGYNHGWGASQNNTFKQRVAAAVPSHGGQLPGGYGMPGAGAMGMPIGGPGMAGPQLHPAMMGGMGMGGMPGGAPLGPRFTTGRSQVRFVKPQGMKIAWQSGEADNSFTPPQLEAPARYNFLQARIYRLKVTDIQGRAGLELYPSMEVYPGNSKVDAYLAHNPVPVEFTDEDFDQVQAGNYVTKVIYLPDPKFQELAIAGVETLVSTRLDPGVDPVLEANRRGSILAVVRMGNVDLEMPHSPELFNAEPPMMMGPAVGPAGPGMPPASQMPMTTGSLPMGVVPEAKVIEAPVKVEAPAKLPIPAAPKK